MTAGMLPAYGKTAAITPGVDRPTGPVTAKPRRTAIAAGRLVADGMLKLHLGEVHGRHDLASGAAGLAARRIVGRPVFPVD